MSGRPTAITRPFINPIDMKKIHYPFGMHNPVLRLRHAEPERLHRSAGRSGTDRAAPCRRTARSGTIPHEPADQPYRTSSPPEGEGLQSYLARINAFNSRPDSATSWNEVVSNEGISSRGCSEKSPATSRCFRDAPQRRQVIRPPASVQAWNVLSTAPLASGTPEFRELERSLGLADEKRTGALRTDARTIRDRSPAATGPRPQRRLLRHPALRFARSPRPSYPESVLPLFTVRMEGTGSSTALRPRITGPPANDKTANAKGESRDNSAFETAPADYDDWSYPPTASDCKNAFLLAAAPRAST